MSNTSLSPYQGCENKKPKLRLQSMTLSHISGGFCNTVGAGHRADCVQAKLKCFARALDWGSPAARLE